MLSDVQLSRHAIERRISDINMAVESQLHSDFQACEYFSVALDESCDIQDKPPSAIFSRFASTDCLISVALDESCDIQDKPPSAIFSRFVSTDCLIKEELLDIVPLKDRTRGIDVKEAMMAAIEKANLPIAKQTATITDGAQATIGSVNELVGLRKADPNIS